MALDFFVMPLKLKYRNPNSRLLKRQGLDPVGGTLVYQAGRFGAKPRTNAGKKSTGISLAPHRKAYLGSVSH